jgi:hypothetical protein
VLHLHGNKVIHDNFKASAGAGWGGCDAEQAEQLI